MKTFLIFKRDINGDPIDKRVFIYRSDLMWTDSGKCSSALLEPRCIHLNLPDGMDANTCSPVFVDGSWALQENPGKKTIELENKLNDFRAIQVKKLARINEIVNDIVLGVRSDKVAVNNYYQYLLNIDDGYKDYATNPGQATALNDLDITKFSWQDEP